MINLKSVMIAAAVIIASASIAEAGNWSRSGSATGPRGGTWTSQSHGSCANGACTSSRTVTGPHGGTYTRDSSTTCGGGSCTRDYTITGPRGGTVSGTRTWSRP